MLQYAIIENPEECRRLWQEAFPPLLITDLWDVRNCFHRFYRRPLSFVAALDRGRLCGLLPLCWVAEENAYMFFPGETYHGQTWLEQNRIFATSRDIWEGLLVHCPGPYILRYLHPPAIEGISGPSPDEDNFCFIPSLYNNQIDNYFLEFSNKTLKRLKRELNNWTQYNLTYRFDHAPDFSAMIQLNEERYGEESYFQDPRFQRSFLELLRLFESNGWLRLTTILDGTKPIAVDMGCLYNQSCTIFAGGTHGDYPGIAKLINLNHMTTACRLNYREIDFLCGSFSWKTQFHLTPRPTYRLSTAEPLTTAYAALEIPDTAKVGMDYLRKQTMTDTSSSPSRIVLN